MRALTLLPILLLAGLLLAGCVPPPDRPMDEVPVQRSLPSGEREYRFADGCVIVLAPSQAVLRREGPGCALFQRDIALLYASGD